jgi:hypothetical protein
MGATLAFGFDSEEGEDLLPERQLAAAIVATAALTVLWFFTGSGLDCILFPFGAGTFFPFGRLVVGAGCSLYPEAGCFTVQIGALFTEVGWSGLVFFGVAAGFIAHRLAMLLLFVGFLVKLWHGNTRVWVC